jgi:hypothetical protein
MDLRQEGLVGSNSPSVLRLLWIKLLLGTDRTPRLTVKLRSDTKKDVVRVRFAVSKATRQAGMYYGWALHVQPMMVRSPRDRRGNVVRYKLSLRPADGIGRLDPLA